MPSPPRLPPGSPVWADLLSSDPDTSLVFYSRVFGWTAIQSGPEFGGYVNFFKHNEPVAGMVSNTGPSPDLWTVYLSTSDADDTAAMVVANEGQVLAQDRVADLGVMVIFADPTGAVVGAWQPGSHSGYGIVGETGTPVWHELHTTGYPAALRFYENVFEWAPVTLADSDDFRMSTVGAGPNAVAGIFDASQELDSGETSRWMIYFGVADAEETALAVTVLGGTVLSEIAESPFGRVAEVSDPTGARFRIIEIPPA